MNGELIAVGSELLLGQIVNTNGRYLSQALAESGINVYYHTVVGDNATRLHDVLSHAVERSDLIVLTGGLGPTKDDVTKEVVAAFLGRNLVYDQVAMEQIEAFFVRRQLVMTENNRKQALVIEGATVLENDHGLAPGMFVEKEGKKFVLLPGPPKEMEPMVKEKLLPLLREKGTGEQITSRVLRFFGIGESALEAELEDLLEQQTNPTIAPLAGDGEVTLRLTVKHRDPAVAKALLDRTENKITERVGTYLYGYDDTSLMKELFAALQQKKLTIASAESLTGGLFGARFTSIAEASSCFYGGVTTYTNEAKQSWLNVSKTVLETDGAVSEACAKEMALGIQQRCQTDVGISFTGVAGPAALEGKEPGTVYLGIVVGKQEPIAHRLQLAGGRELIRERSIQYGCYYILKELKRWNYVE
ncbi:competence/damage-inducible protein A [Halalkalibacterium ligniniphilum]|uniref:competence/damage-inducible protein A n=1 Tax=Halalkalibacterium ligniniphilum TaxID=1134413 RepID=UPI00034B3E65|nr:competence/damage-inducible protein A [Halalkalibacterium ligniniphilum]